MTDELKKLVIACKQTFAGEAGTIVLNYLSDYCYEKKSTFVEDGHDKQNVNNGKRSVILEIRRLMGIDPEAKEPEKKPEPKFI